MVSRLEEERRFPATEAVDIAIKNLHQSPNNVQHELVVRASKSDASRNANTTRPSTLPSFPDTDRCGDAPFAPDFPVIEWKFADGQEIRHHTQSMARPKTKRERSHSDAGPLRPSPKKSTMVRSISVLCLSDLRRGHTLV